jgi:hypothetical protein
VVLLLHTSSRRADAEFVLILASAASFLGLVQKSWRIWTTRVTVDEIGLSWTKGFAADALRWEEISEFGYRYEGKRGTRLVVGPVRGKTKFLHPLPILPRELYELLKARIGGLPPEVERDLYS